MNSWPFDQPRDCAVLVTREVLNRAEPILHVTHDADNHGWQLIGFSDGTVENGRVISMQEAVELDPSVLQLADLPVGWRAVRDSPDSAWRREAIRESIANQLVATEFKTGFIRHIVFDGNFSGTGLPQNRVDVAPSFSTNCLYGGRNRRQFAV